MAAGAVPVGRGAEVDAWVPGGRRALDLAVCAGHAEVVRLLLAAGADPRIDAGPYDEATPPPWPR